MENPASDPFFGPVRVALLLATMQTPWRFRTKRNLWGYVGLAVVTCTGPALQTPKNACKLGRPRIPCTAIVRRTEGLTTRLTKVQWLEPRGGTPMARGQLGGTEVSMQRAAHPRLQLGAVGVETPLDLVAALNEAGVGMLMIGCRKLGTDEFNRAYLLNSPDFAPIAVGLHSRTAPTGDATSFYNIGLDLPGYIPTFDELLAVGGDWGASCPP